MLPPCACCTCGTRELARKKQVTPIWHKTANFPLEGEVNMSCMHSAYKMPTWVIRVSRQPWLHLSRTCYASSSALFFQKRQLCNLPRNICNIYVIKKSESIKKTLVEYRWQILFSCVCITCQFVCVFICSLYACMCISAH